MSNVSVISDNYHPPRDIWLLSDKLIQYAELVNFVFICGSLSLFGTVTNIINLIVFFRMGFNETINISLFALGVSDLCSLITLLWVSVCYNPLLWQDDINIHFLSFNIYTGIWPHVIFTRITGFITIFITIERCLCIIIPLKVKDILTPKCVTTIMVAIYVIVSASMMPNFFTTRFVWRWIPRVNRTMFYLDSVANFRRVELVSQYIQIFYIIVSFTLISVSTSVFAWKLNRRGQWLQSASTEKENAPSKTRDQQIIKLVIWVAAIFFFSYIPALLLTIAFASSSEIDTGKKYHNLCVLLMSFTHPAEAINSSVNIFIYYKMMSKYKRIFHLLFCKHTNSITASDRNSGNRTKIEKQ